MVETTSLIFQVQLGRRHILSSQYLWPGFLYRKNQQTYWYPEATWGESMGSLLQAIRWTTNLGYQKTIFEGNRKMIVDNITSATIVIFDFHVSMSKCRELLLKFSNSRVSFVRRQANNVAYTLAKTLMFNVWNQSFDYTIGI